MKHSELLDKVRARIVLCRNLAETTTDDETARALREIAADGERDLRALEIREELIPFRQG